MNPSAENDALTDEQRRELYEAFHHGKCPTLGCRGDERYAAPGRGHIDGCTYPIGSVIPPGEGNADA